MTIDTRGGGCDVPAALSSLPANYLVRHPDQVVGRAEIAEHVWDETFDPLSNLIEVYVQRLRRKIDEGHSRKLLRTIRGGGYMLSSEEAATNVIDPANFVDKIDNPYFPLTPGTVFIYEGQAKEGLVHTEFFVTHKTVQILGVTTRGGP